MPRAAASFGLTPWGLPLPFVDDFIRLSISENWGRRSGRVTRSGEGPGLALAQEGVRKTPGALLLHSVE
jgi:hypothetical protein